MLKVEHYSRIRRAHRDGMSIRAIARTFHHSRRKVRQVLGEPEPRAYTRSKSPAAPVLGPFVPVIEAILAADEQAPPKQRHTGMQVYRRLLQEHGYSGSYDPVRRYLAKRRRRQRETFIPLAHDPGQRLEADFGHIYVDFPEGRRHVSVLLLVWSYSNCPFALALPTQRVEAILAGMVQGFEFFGCIPREVWWDNPTTVVRSLLRGRQRELHGRYAALASHYRFEPLFCLPARGNEKPYVENWVYTLQRRWATPVPQAKDLAHLNQYLHACCLQDRTQAGAGGETLAQRFERDRAQALPLPTRPFDPCVLQVAKVDKYQTIHFDRNCYSVPRAYAFQTVTVKAYVEQVEVVVQGQLIARHERSYERDQQILDPVHYLASLERRPAALDHAGVYRHWQLPAAFAQLRSALEGQHGPLGGARQYIRVLQLLADHPVERVQCAINRCQPHDPDADRIIQWTRRLAEQPSAVCADVKLAESLAHVGHVHVPRPNMSVFDQLLSSGDPVYDHQPPIAFEDQPQTFAAPLHECGV